MKQTKKELEALLERNRIASSAKSEAIGMQQRRIKALEDEVASLKVEVKAHVRRLTEGEGVRQRLINEKLKLEDDLSEMASMLAQKTRDARYQLGQIYALNQELHYAREPKG